MREIAVDEVAETVRTLCVEANHELRSDQVDALRRARDAERSPTGREVLDRLLENAEVSAAELDDRAAQPGAQSRRLHWLAVSLALCAADGIAILLCGIVSFALTAEKGSGADLLTCFVIAAAPVAAASCFQGRNLYSRSAVLRGASIQDVASGWLQAFGLVLLVATSGVASRHAFRLWGQHDLGFAHIPSRLGQAWTLSFVASGLAALILVRLGWAFVRRHVLRGDVAGEVARFARHHDARTVATTPSPSPRFRRIVEELEAQGFTVQLWPERVFAASLTPLDLTVHAKYWGQVSASAFGP